MTPLDVIASAVPLASGSPILDVGCGSGALSRALLARGARPVGIDPSAEPLQRARAAVPDAAFVQAAAEALPFRNGAAAGTVFLNSLHHVPEPAMEQALREAARVTVAEGAVLVIEPLAAGTFFSALLAVEDETAVRAAAQATVRTAVDKGLFKLVDTVEYVRHERFTEVGAFLAQVVAADRARASIVAQRRDAIEAAFYRFAARGPDGGWVLEQPIRAHVLRPCRTLGRA